MATVDNHPTAMDLYFSLYVDNFDKKSNAQKLVTIQKYRDLAAKYSDRAELADALIEAADTFEIVRICQHGNAQFEI
ncbi:MAG: hypothetical protein ACPG3V_02325 [Porticoccaceae bacterium]|jgi:hypothetical protein